MRGGSENTSCGRWTHEEHTSFVRGLREHGKNWKMIAAMVPTRTVVQIRTHAQKYFLKLEKSKALGLTDAEAAERAFMSLPPGESGSSSGGGSSSPSHDFTTDEDTVSEDADSDAAPARPSSASSWQQKGHGTKRRAAEDARGGHGSPRPRRAAAMAAASAISRVRGAPDQPAPAPAQAQQQKAEPEGGDKVVAPKPKPKPKPAPARRPAKNKAPRAAAAAAAAVVAPTPAARVARAPKPSKAAVELPTIAPVKPERQTSGTLTPFPASAITARTTIRLGGSSPTFSGLQMLRPPPPLPFGVAPLSPTSSFASDVTAETDVAAQLSPFGSTVDDSELMGFLQTPGSPLSTTGSEESDLTSSSSSASDSETARSRFAGSGGGGGGWRLRAPESAMHEEESENDTETDSNDLIMLSLLSRPGSPSGSSRSTTQESTASTCCGDDCSGCGGGGAFAEQEQDQDLARFLFEGLGIGGGPESPEIGPMRAPRPPPAVVSLDAAAPADAVAAGEDWAIGSAFADEEYIYGMAELVR